jgi:hypothetical protein
MARSMLHMFVCRFSHVFTHYISLKDQGQTLDKTVLKLMQELKDGGRVEVNIKPVFIFLFKNGGPFSLMYHFPITDPIRQALSSPSTQTTTSSSLSLSDGG